MPCPRNNARAIASAVSRSESISVPSRSNKNPRITREFVSRSLGSERGPVAAVACPAALVLIVDELAERDAHLEPERQHHAAVVVPLAVDVDLVTRIEHLGAGRAVERLRQIRVERIRRAERERWTPVLIDDLRLDARLRQ